MINTKNGRTSGAGDDQSVCVGRGLCQGAGEAIAASGALAIRGEDKTERDEWEEERGPRECASLECVLSLPHPL